MLANSRGVADYFGKAHRAVKMTRDGFTLLVMGFSGAKARQFKRTYIDAFNRMEAQLRRWAIHAIPSGSEP